MKLRVSRIIIAVLFGLQILLQSTASFALSPTSQVVPTGAGSTEKQQTLTTKGPELEATPTVHATITNNDKSDDVSVMDSVKAGDAASNTALTTVTVLNALHSALGLRPDSVQTFNTDITARSVGDIVLDPYHLPNATPLVVTNPSQAASATQIAGITTDITLRSQSGNARVTKNAGAGSATSGDALAVANIANLINTSIDADQSFIGTINIYGDLEGDILFPENIKQQLLTGQAPTVSLPLDQFNNPHLVTEFASKFPVSNTVAISSKSGGANVANNSTAGAAAKGDTSKSLTVLNLTGQQVVGDHVLLVFVNVMGTWVGALMNAPDGTTTAQLGGMSTRATTRPTATVSGTNRISNSINVQATSGDAHVTENVHAGSATSGKASAGVNILNASDNTIILTDWFGVLFINVFGEWKGSLGVDTVAGGLSTQTPEHTSPQAKPAVQASSLGMANDTHPIKPVTPATVTYSTEPDEVPPATTVLGASSTASPTPPPAPNSTPVAHQSLTPVVASLVAISGGLLLVILERLHAARKRRTLSISM